MSKHAERVHARTEMVVDSSDGYARRRFRGQPRRGQPSILTRDMADCRIALASLTRAYEALVKAADETLPPFDRDELHREGLGQVALAGRAVDEIVLRPHSALNLKNSTRSPR